MRRLLLTSAAILPFGTALAQQPPQPPAAFKQSASTGQVQTGTGANQTQSQSGTGQAQTTVQPKDATRTIFRFGKDVRAETAGQVEGQLSALLSDPRLKDLPLNRVVVKGTSTPQQTAQGTVVSIQWSAVTLDDASRSAALDKPMMTRLLSKQPAIPTKTEVSAQGDVDALAIKIQSLFKTTPEEEKEKEEKKKTERASAAPKAGGGASQNDVAASYKPLAPREAKQAGDIPETPPVIGQTSEGCSVRVDWDTSQVYPQSAQTSTQNGVTTRSDCKDSGPGVPMQWEYQTCTDGIDLEKRTATPFRRPYYIDKGGLPAYLATCKADPTQTFTITEDASACQVMPDLTSMQAIQMSALVYTNKNNAKITVETCLPREKAAKYPISRVTQGCAIRPDFEKGTSYQQERLIYSASGVEHNISGCSDSATTYKHIMDTANCPVKIDTDSKKAIEMGQFRIDTPLGPQWLSTCAPTGLNADIKETIEGCESIHSDFMEVGYSLGASRFYHELTGTGKRTYISECQPNNTDYPHNFVQAGWEHDDNKKESKSKVEVYIQLPAPAGKTLISPAAIRSQSTTVPYILNKIADEPNGSVVFQSDVSCQAYTGTDKSEIYDRPDLSQYKIKIGEGTPINPRNACTYANEWNLASNTLGATSWYYSSSYNGLAYNASRLCVYNGKRIANREDGKKITIQVHNAAPSSIPSCEGLAYQVAGSCYIETSIPSGGAPFNGGSAKYTYISGNSNVFPGYVSPSANSCPLTPSSTDGATFSNSLGWY